LTERLGVQVVEMTSDNWQPGTSTIVLRVVNIRHRFINMTTSLYLSDAYVVTTTADDSRGTGGVVDVAGQTSAGVFYGVQTLLELVSDGKRRLVAGEVIDAPRFAYRGLMLDVARNFIPLNALQRTIDTMAAYKLNRLHLHLTDDQVCYNNSNNSRIVYILYLPLGDQGCIKNHYQFVSQCPYADE